MGWRRLIVVAILPGRTSNSDTLAEGVAGGEVKEMQDRMRPTQGRVGEQVEVGSTVRVRDAWGEEQHTLVGPSQSDLARGRISVESPVGRALLGRRLGDQIQVQTPGGLRVLSIVEVAGPDPGADHRSAGPCRP